MLKWIEQYIGSGFSLHLLNGLVAFITVMVVGFIVKYLLQTLGRKLTSSTKTDLDNRLLEVILPRIKWLAIIIGLYLATERIAKGIRRTDEIGQQLIQYFNSIIYIGFTFIISILIIRLTDTALKHIIGRHVHATSSALYEAVLPLLNRLVFILIVFIAIVIALGHFGVDVSSLLVFLGGSSVAIALAAQETLANMIAGFVIMLDRPFRTGDRIKIPSGEVGDVYQIGLRSTKILDADHNLIVCPNSELTKAKIINYSYPGIEIRIIIDIGIAHGTSIEQAREIMLKLAHQHPDVLKQPNPEVFFTTMGEWSCTLQLVGRTDDWKKKFRAETSLREQIYNAFIKEGINPGYPHRVVHLPSSLSNAAPKND